MNSKDGDSTFPSAIPRSTLDRIAIENRDTSEVTIGGAAGAVPARLGEVRDFEIGGRTVPLASAVFARKGSGALDDPYTEGTVGAGVLGGLEVVFDYCRRRIAFAPAPRDAPPR